MKWFRKLFPKRSVKSSKSEQSTMNWFKQATDMSEDNRPTLRSEIDVMPRTEFTASRQALNNMISIALGEGESSGTANVSNNKDCRNKFCCGSEAQRADNGDDESIKHFKSKSKSQLIDESAEGSSNDESVSRRPSKAAKYVKNSDYIVYFDPYVDYGRLECPDSLYPSIIDYPTIRFGKYVHLKTQKERNYCDSFDLFTTSDKLCSAEIDKSSLNYKLLSNVEHCIDEAKFNLLNCKIYNDEFRNLRERLGFAFIHDEDFNDDNKSTRMSADTRAVKEFYKLSVDGNLHVHFNEITVETGQPDEVLGKKTFANFVKWLALKGKEIKEEHKISDGSWIKTFLKLFARTSK